jgi:hypothetical protein
VALRLPNGLFLSHSLPSFGSLPEFRFQALEKDPSDPADLAPGGAIYSLIWGRDTRPETVEAFFRVVGAEFLVSGHIPCEYGFSRPSPRHLILDSLGSPAACALLPANRPLEPEDLDRCVILL